MKITIHRGNQIGGCITEIESASGTKIIIDLGHNLPDGDNEAPDEYASKEAIETLLKGVSAVLYTHNHGDHVELFNFVPDEIPQYIGPLAARLMELKYEKLSVLEKEHDACVGRIRKLAAFHNYTAGKSFKVGDIRITPFYVSHSATDSYMLKVECDGKTLLHTGDFREHGYLGDRLRKVLDGYHIARHVDVLIIEGTNVGQAGKPVKSEQEVSDCFREIMDRRKNVFILCSSQDADRLASIYRACYGDRRYKPLVCDNFQKKIMLSIADAYRGEELYSFSKKRVYDYTYHAKGLTDKMKEVGFAMLIRRSDKFSEWIQEVLKFCKKEETTFVYSMYLGYVDKKRSGYSPKTVEFIKPLLGHSSPCLEGNRYFDYNHTSGHASMQSLKEICEQIAPKTAIIPIHKDADADFVSILPDNLRSKVCEGNCCKDGIEVCLSF